MPVVDDPSAVLEKQVRAGVFSYTRLTVPLPPPSPFSDRVDS